MNSRSGESADDAASRGEKVRGPLRALSARLGGRSRLRQLIHHVGIDITDRRMPEGRRQAPDHFKSQRLPQSERAHSRAAEEIELHGAKAARTCIRQRVLADAAGKSTVGGVRLPHVATLQTCRPRRRGSVEGIGAHDYPLLHGDKGLSVTTQPVRPCLRLAQVRIERTRLAVPEGWQDVGCDFARIAELGRANLEHARSRSHAPYAMHSIPLRVREP